jgi:hypothetical protein
MGNRSSFAVCVLDSSLQGLSQLTIENGPKSKICNTLSPTQIDSESDEWFQCQVEPIPEHPRTNIPVENPNQDEESVGLLTQFFTYEILEEFNKDFGVNFVGREDCTDYLQKPLSESTSRMPVGSPRCSLHHPLSSRLLTRLP